MRRDPDPVTPVDAIEEDLLTQAHVRRPGQIRDAVDDDVVGRSNLEDHFVDLVVDERLERLFRQIDMGARRIDANVLGNVERRIEQRAIVRVVRRAHRDPVRDGRRAGDHQQQRAHQKPEQAAPDARGHPDVVIHRR